MPNRTGAATMKIWHYFGSSQHNIRRLWLLDSTKQAHNQQQCQASPRGEENIIIMQYNDIRGL